MSIKRNYVLGVISDEDIPEFEDKISKHALFLKLSSSHVYYARQPAHPGAFAHDIIFFQLEGDDDAAVEKKLQRLFDDLDNAKMDYLIINDETGEVEVRIKYGARIDIKFDNLKTIPEGTFRKIDGLKTLNTDFGHSKGFKPAFRPIEGNAIEDLKVHPETIYIASKTEENFYKMIDYMTERIMEIDSDFIIEWSRFSSDEHYTIKNIT